ncbi:MAG TPA: hypothetical protein VLQ80_15605, partial [Candidatus Saccharimonadia bacterium]|nr:hypothetical protein [Candidatus Saccharimonadia bacterium]
NTYRRVPETLGRILDVHPSVDSLERVVYLSPADNSHRLTQRLSQGQKDLEKRALMASQRPSEPW